MATYLDELVQKITTKADLKGFDDLDRKQKRAIKSNDLLAKSFRRAFGIFFGIQGIRSVIQTTRDLDLLQKSIKGLTGSVQDWQFLRQEAYRTGTSLKTIAGTYKNFYSAARGSGFNGNQIQGMFSGLLTAGRGIGASQQQIGGALVALEQMLSKGKVSAEELRKQLGNALPGAVEIAQRAMGVTGAQFEEMMKKGISAAEFVPKFIAQAEKELGKGFKENIKSLDFALVNLNTAWLEFQANILQGEAGEALAQLVRDVTKILRSQTLLRFIRLISKALGFVIKHIKTILLLFGINKIMQYINSFKNLHAVLWEIATTTNTAGEVTQMLATSYAMLTSGQILAGIKNLARATGTLIAPWLRLLGVLGTVLSSLLMVIDIYETFIKKNPDSLLNRAGATNTRNAYRGMGTLGGAALGGTAGLVIGGPWGAAIGAGIGALYGRYGLGDSAFEAEQIMNAREIRLQKQNSPMIPFRELQAPKSYNELFPLGSYSNQSSQTSNNAHNIYFNPTYNINGTNLSESDIALISNKEFSKIMQQVALSNGY